MNILKQDLELILSITFAVGFLFCYIDNTNGCRNPKADPIKVSPLKCSYVEDLIGNGVDTIEAMQNMDCCNDPFCKFHSDKY